MQPKHLSYVLAVLATINFAAVTALEAAPCAGRGTATATDRLTPAGRERPGTSEADVARSRVAGSIDDEDTLLAQSQLKNRTHRSANRPAYRELGPGAIVVLRPAFGWARVQAERMPACRGLFEELGTDPLMVLTSTEYTGPLSVEDQMVCRARDAVAFTQVGPGRTVLCQQFGQLEIREAAAYLIHEALHNAGQTEWPSDPAAPTSAEIQSLVRRKCRL